MGRIGHRRLLMISVALTIAAVGVKMDRKSTVIAATLAQTSQTQFEYSASPVVATIRGGSSPILRPTFFGMTIHRLFEPGLSKAKWTPFPSFPVSTMRLWDVVTWRDIEPARGRYSWDKMDGIIKTARDSGVSDFIFTLGMMPTWASSNPGGVCGPPPNSRGGTCFMPSNLDYLDEFATALTRRYCGSVRYFETWNEPNDSRYWAGTNSQLITVAQHWYRIVRDPKNCGCVSDVCAPGRGSNPNQVLMPSIAGTSGERWLNKWSAVAGSRYPYADIVAFHGYGYADQPERVDELIQYMRQTAVSVGLGSKQMWNTEASWGKQNGYSELENASWLMRYHLVLAATGWVDRFIWYAYDNCEWGTLWDGPYCNKPVGMRAAGIAYATIQKWLTGTRCDWCEAHRDGTWVCRLSQPNRYVAYAMWNIRGAINIEIPKTSKLGQYRDWQNHIKPIPQRLTIDTMPVLLESSTRP